MPLPSVSQRLSGHLSRWLIAAILMPPVLYAILTENVLIFWGLVTVAGGLVWWEYFTNVLGRERIGLLVVSLIGWVSVTAGTQFFGPQGQLSGLLFALFLGAGYTLINLPKLNGPLLINLLSRYALGHLYISLGFSFLILLRQRIDGERWIIYLLVLNVVADTVAFYVGRHFKGPKLYVPASPNKTISGLLGGVLGGTIVSALSPLYLSSGAGWLVMAILGACATLLAVFGDLFESSLKRALEIKDSSRLLLGHGGFWDRLDGLIFTAGPIYLFTAIWIGI